jgi:hypothetical protein
MKDPFRHIRKILEEQQRIQKILEPQLRIIKIAEEQIRLLKIAEPHLRAIDSTREFKRMYESIARMRIIESQIPILNPAIREDLDKIIRIRENIDQFNKNLPGYLVLIANYGWYLDLQTDANLSVRLAHEINDKNIEKVDNYLIEYYTTNANAIIEKLSTNHSNRSKIFNEIKKAFDNEYYYLAIPLILTQIDGICYDYTKKLFFIKNKKKEKNPFLPKVSNELVVFNNEFFKAFLAPFFNNAPIFAHEDSLELFPTTFNRHRVLHGIDAEFGTKINCLKVFSLLSYSEDVLFRISNDM